MKKIYFAAMILAVASCSMEQKPAPYDVYGTTFYGKNSTRPVSNNQPVYHSNDTLDAASPDYNSQIDQRNSNAVVAKPIGGNQPSKLQSSAVTSSNGITARPLGEAPAIDGNEQVVKLNSGKTLIHSGSSTTLADSKTQAFVPHEETVPPVQESDNSVNPAEKNAQRNADEKLSHLKPIPKPAYIPPKPEVVDAKAKITPKITQAETSTIGKPITESNNDVTDNSDVEPETAAPVKKIPVDAERVIDNQAAKTKRETTIAAQNAIAQPAESVPPVEKPSVVEKAEPEVGEAAPLAEVPAAAPATPAKAKSQFIKPVDGTIVSEFGGDSSGGGAFNDGINIQAPEGTPVKASAAGTVVYSGNQLQGYGNMVIVKHSNGFLTAYSHLKGLEVKKGDAVGQGDVIGHVGKTGNVNNPQLHFGIRKGREPVDPKDYL